MKDFIELKGVFELNIFKIVDGKKILVENYIDNNTIVNLGKEKVVKLIGNDDGFHYITSIGFGTSNVNPTVMDIGLTNIFTKGVSNVVFPTYKSVKFEWELLVNENNNVNIVEFGLLCSDGTLFARKVRGVIQKKSDVYLSGAWTIEIL